MPPLNIYKASAGSGKTFALTMEYLKLLFTQKGIHRHILAVTFTNKAAGEMKHRILDRLHELSLYREGDELEEMRLLREATGLGSEAISLRSEALLKEILNDYSGFSVGTIDKFFQSVIRAFTREIGIQPAYNLELDHTRILSLAVDLMFQELGNRKDLQRWLIRFAEERMESTASWNFKNEIILLGKQLFMEAFQSLFEHQDIDVLNKENLDLYLSDIRKLENECNSRIKEIGLNALQRIQNANLEPENFSGASRSIPQIFLKARDGEKLNFSDTRLKGMSDPGAWLKKSDGIGMLSLVESELMPLLNELYQQWVVVNTVDAVRSYFYTLGILADIWNYVRTYTRERNLFLIADSSRFLKGIIGGSQVPFVYERTGSRFQHIMLDEFQDTSQFQYENFRPLLDNSLASGNLNLVVGDVKQSIYRWRNSDWKILASDLEEDFSHQELKVETLDKNYRSAENIVRFNNSLFQLASALLGDEISMELSSSEISSEEAHREEERFRKAYDDVVQNIPSHLQGTGGRVQMHILDDEEGVFQDDVLELLPGWVEELQATGIEPGQIAILVRTSRQGARVASSLLEYARQSGKEGNFRLISNDSLLLVQNTSVSFLVSLLRYSLQPDHIVNNALLKQLYTLLNEDAGDAEGSRFMYDLSPDKLFPEEFIEQREGLKLLPLFELSESLVEIFKLGKRSEDMPYIQAFQELILDLQRKEAMGVADFLDYWEQNGSLKSVAVSEASNAIRIMTIHKSKGLEFEAVIVPFCDWSLTPDSRHTNILWCHTLGTGLERIPVVPLKYKKELIHTRFAPDYYRERMKSYMDSLNLLYVACTRARHQLILGLPGSRGKGLKNVSDLLVEVLGRKAVKEPCTPSLNMYLDNNHLDYGESPSPGLKDELKDPWEFSDYPVNLRSRSLRIRLRNDQYFLDEAGLFRTERSFGNMMHELFSGMKSLEDLPMLLDSYEQSGLIPRSERDPLEELIRSKLKQPLVSDWFSRSERIINERAILCGNSKVLRPDRVMINRGHVTLVDFKFGELQKHTYHTQVRAYMEQLKQMGHQQVEGYLWYVMMDQIVKVEG